MVEPAHTCASCHTPLPPEARFCLNCGAATPAETGRQPSVSRPSDEQFARLRDALADRYRIERVLGQGGMATVYLADDLRHDRKVAVKVLRPELAAAVGLDRFLREIGIAAKLQHPHILMLIDSGEADGFLYYVMPFVEGESLRTKLAREREVPLTEAVRILRDVVDALAYAHEHGVVHRDIKPDNVMITGRHALVTDFGVAKAVTQARSTSPLTSAGVSLGTPTYMAPEQIAADPNVDHRADLYALGVTAYELLTGAPPFEDEAPQQLLAAHLARTPRPIREVRPEIPAPLADIVMRCLEKQPVDRWQHADDIMHALEPFSTPGSGTTTTHGGGRRQMTRAGIAALAALAVAGAVWVGAHLWPHGGGEARVVVVVPLTSIGDETETRAFGDGLLEILASRLTQLTRAADLPVWVIPPNEVRDLEIGSAAKARAQLNATLAITGSVQRAGDVFRLTLNLVDAVTLRQLRSSVIEGSMADVATWQRETVVQTLEMLGLDVPQRQVATPSPGGTRNARAYELYVRGRGILQRSDRTRADIATAIGWFTEALAADSTFALAHAGIGEAYWLQYGGSKDTTLVGRAVVASRRALTLADSLPDVWATLALIDNGMGQPEEALASAQRALALDPHHTAAQLQMADAYRRLQRLDDAESVLDTLTAQEPHYWRGYSQYAFLRYRQGRYAEAAALFARAGELAPGNAMVLRNAGVMYFILDRWDEAKTMIERSLAIEPTPAAFTNLGVVEYFQGDYASAAERFRAALALQERDATHWRNLGDALRQLPGREAEARSAYERSIQLAEARLRVDPTDAFIFSGLAFAHAVLGHHDTARAIFERLSSEGTDDADLMFGLAQIAEEIGDREAAVAWLVRSLEGGYSRRSAQREPQLAGVRADPRVSAVERALAAKDTS